MEGDKYLLYMYENPMDRAAGLICSVIEMPPRVANAPSMRRVFHAAYTTVAGEMAAQQQQQIMRGGQEVYAGGSPQPMGPAKTVVTVREFLKILYPAVLVLWPETLTLHNVCTDRWRRLHGLMPRQGPPRPGDRHGACRFHIKCENTICWLSNAPHCNNIPGRAESA